MKFFSKKSDSKILVEDLVYKKNSSSINSRIRDYLIEEQSNFCAYTEKYLQGLDSVEVEHFNSSIKYSDDYYNYYAVLRKPNLFKKDEKYKGASFFTTKFFQKTEELLKRVKYLKGDFVFEEADKKDTEAKDFIDFIGFNNPDLYTHRKTHINRLKGIFEIANYNEDSILAFFRNHREELSFITALEHELNVDLSEFYN